ncbi:DUF1697 domain-containing protein [Brucepastera parasyntrophica]|uniref:DUF1697 domain-containing protein n=1 Tax=Brucepastera parasyntrophica TaxID=2880008 RepID=UPI0021096B28|nr:DUF1697 domain-containing protein [Brucepastera parasyntrophica]ULQ60468.1 DUF1697 domain-containing protein [Brucepastera parasyntrophica]
MERYAALLRGINLNGKNSIQMEALKKVFENIGIPNVKAYLQSGNIIFENHTEEKPDILEKIIENKIRQEFNYTVPVMIISISQMEAIITNNPYRDTITDVSNFYVTLFFKKVDMRKIDTEKITARATQGEVFEIRDRMIYLNCPNGYGKTKLTNTFFENILKVTATTRNWKTINKIIEISKEE